MSKTYTELQSMDLEDAKEYIELFTEEFGQAHLYFAQHAAFPLALTPDLLYRLWINFQRNSRDEKLSIPWIAVADLLLSQLCKEVGHELYEMDITVRAELLNRLKKDESLGMPRIYELSDFLLDYVRQQLSSDSNTRTSKFANAQRWTALAYTQPSKAARELSEALDALSQNKAEQVRVVSLIEVLSALAEPEGFEPLLVRVRSVEHTTQSDGGDVHVWNWEAIEELRVEDSASFVVSRNAQQESEKHIQDTELEVVDRAVEEAPDVEQPARVLIASSLQREEPQTWRELLGMIISNSKERQRIASKVGVHPGTLTRWALDQSTPRDQSLLALVRAFPEEYRVQLTNLIREEFPDFLVEEE